MKRIGLGIISLMLLAFTNISTVGCAAGVSKPVKHRLSDNIFYYVAKNGSDSNPGTEAKPWLTMNKAAATLVAGDTAYVKKGTYAPIKSFANSGTKGNLITFRAYPGHNVKIELGGNNLTINKDYIRIEGFRITGGGTVYLHGATGCELISNYIHKGSGVGLRVSKGGRNVIKSNDIALNKSAGMYVGYKSNYNKILENAIHDNGKNGLNIKASANFNLVEKNEIYKNHHEDAINVYGSPKEGYPTTEHNVIQFNVIHDQIGVGHVDGIQTYFGANNNRFCNNLIYRIRHQPFMIGDGSFGNVFEGNIVWQPNIEPFSKHSHCIWNNKRKYWKDCPGAQGNKIIHNTICGANCIISWNRDIVFRDNIIAPFSHKFPIELSGKRVLNLTADYNLLYSAKGVVNYRDTAEHYTGVAAWYAAKGYEKHGKDGDPLFVDLKNMDLRLKPESPAKEAASDGKDMGAYFPNMFIATLIRVTDMEGGSVTITWETTKSADSTIEYGKTTAYEKSKNDRALRTSHSTKLTKLSQGEYHYRVKSKDATGYEATSSDYTFYVFEKVVP
ncbi:MAG: right-handed parallel beta-helix repeat-containing protein [Phycisphaerae bacterium]|nr:right-handed parallel beta-helix repeat-containing protein [Phycisphaerae bacterium]